MKPTLKEFLRICSFCLGLLFLLPLSCSERDSMIVTPPAQAPGVVPTDTPSPIPSPSPTPTATTAGWWKIHERKWCPYPVCPGSHGFSVDFYGRYTVGTELNPPYAEGQILENERVVLNAVASEITENNLFEPLYCETLPPLMGRATIRVRLYTWSGIPVLIYDIDDQNLRFCYRGDQARARALFDTIDDLATKYHV